MEIGIEERLTALEEQAARLEVRTWRLERRSRGGAPPVRPPHEAPAPRVPSHPHEAALTPASEAASEPASTPAPEHARPTNAPPRSGARPHLPDTALEDLLGRRVLGWLGGIAVLTGLLFLLVMAASRGWIGEEARVLMAAAAALALTGTGIWLRERRGLADVALAAAASGCAGLFAAVVVAGPVYDLVPAFAALGAALAVGAATTALALRWHAQGMGWLGLLGAIAAPALVGASGGAAIALMLAAYVATAAIGLWQRWHAISFAAFLLATAQLAVWVDAGATTDAAQLAALAVLGLATAVAAAGFEWRARAPHLRPSAVALLCLNALALAGLGALVLHHPAGWLLALAAAHVAAGLLARRVPRVSRELTVVGLALGVLLADVAFASLVDGLPLVLGWAAGAAGFAALARASRHRADDVAALAGLGGHLLLALMTALATGVAPASALGGPIDATAFVALAALATTAWTAARLLSGRHDRLAFALDGLAIALLVAMSAVALEGAALTVALAGEAAALAAAERRDRRAGTVPLSLGVLVVALGHGLAVLAPSDALVQGLDAVGAAIAGLGAVVAAALAAARGRGPSPITTALVTGAGLTALYLASALVLTPFEPAEQGQPLMSALWALAGVALVVAGLLRDAQPLRLAGLALLGAAAAKVFLADLATLDALYRVGSFLALGLLLLLGGYAWARLRPAAAPRHQYP